MSPLVFVAASNVDTDEWVKAWKLVTTQGADHVSHRTPSGLGLFPTQPHRSR